MYREFLIIIFTITFIACEEVIKVELDDAAPQIVIQANISDNPNNNIVTITKSTDFYNPSEYENVSDAEISVTEIGTNNTFSFTEFSAGKYLNKTLSAKTDAKYKISVFYEGRNYSATSVLNKKLTIDSLQIIGKKRPFRDSLVYQYHLHFQDNPGIKDYARFRIYINDEIKNGIYLYEDRLTDGNHIDYFYFNFEKKDGEIKPGDKVTIELITIDEPIFEYFDTMRSALAASKRGRPAGGTAPSNPTTNWNNDALGYFSVNSVDTITKIIE